MIGHERESRRSVRTIASLSCVALFALPGIGSLVVGALTGGSSEPLWLHGAASILFGLLVGTTVVSPSRPVLGLIGVAALANLPVQAYAFRLADTEVPGAQTAIWMVAGFIWTGQWLGRRLCGWFALPSAAAYSAILVLNPDTTSSDWASAGFVWAVALGVGMTSASLQDRLRIQRRRARRRGELLKLVVTATRGLMADEPTLALRACAEPLRGLGFTDVRITVTDDAGESIEHSFGEPLDVPSGRTDPDDDTRARLLEVAGQPVVIAPVPGPGRSGGQIIARGSATDAGFDNHELEALELLASQLGHAIELARGVQRDRLTLAALSEESRRDPLTTLGNRRVADELIDSLRTGDAVAIADLDHFKAVNDRLGHSVGDEVLGSFAGHVRTSLRPGDSAARWGGEEFLLVLRSAGQSAGTILDRLLHDWIDTEPLATFSAGYAIHGEGEARQRTFEAADRALYKAKNDGRSRVCSADKGLSLEAALPKGRDAQGLKAPAATQLQSPGRRALGGGRCQRS